MKNYIFDTNIIIKFLNGNSEIINKISVLDNIFIPSVVCGELYFGIENSRHKEKNITTVNGFLSMCEVKNIDEKTAKLYGNIKFQLKIKGTPIPENDIWIAALAKQYNCILITNDTHFGNIQDLTIENWSEEK